MIFRTPDYFQLNDEEWQTAVSLAEDHRWDWNDADTDEKMVQILARPNLTGEYLDESSGRNSALRQLEEMLKQVRKRQVDVVLVWKYDRFALVNTLEEFKSLGVDFISYTQQIDTITSIRKFFFVVMVGAA